MLPNVHELPLELLEACLVIAGPEFVSTTCTRVCKFWRTASSSARLWDHFLLQRWPNLLNALGNEDNEVCHKQIYLMLSRLGPSEYHSVRPPEMSNPWSLICTLQIIMEFEVRILDEARTITSVLPLSSARRYGDEGLLWTDIHELEKLTEPEDIAEQMATAQGLDVREVIDGHWRGKLKRLALWFPPSQHVAHLVREADNQTFDCHGFSHYAGTVDFLHYDEDRVDEYILAQKLTGPSRYNASHPDYDPELVEEYLREDALEGRSFPCFQGYVGMNADDRSFALNLSAPWHMDHQGLPFSLPWHTWPDLFVLLDWEC